jgi:hypothetical protein
MLDYLTYGGFWSLSRRHLAYGLEEVYRSLVTSAQVLQ